MTSSISRILLVFLLLFAVSSPVLAQDLMTWQEVERLIDASPNGEVKAYFESVERGTKKERYDIVLRGVYKEPGFKVVMFVTTHRIVGIAVDGKITTKGDANNTADMKTVTKREIIGKVIIDIPYVGYVVTTAKQPYGFAVLIISPAGIIIFDEIKKIWGEVKKIRKKDETEENKTTT